MAPEFFPFILVVAPGIGCLLLAAKQGDIDRVWEPPDRGASPGAWGVDFVRPDLVDAAAGGHTDVVRLLIGRRADHHVTDTDCKSGLEIARENHHDGVAELLVNAGAQP